MSSLDSLISLIYFLYNKDFRHPKGPAKLPMVNRRLWVENGETEDILYRGKAQILAKESSCWAGPQHVRWQLIEPEGPRVAEARKATQKPGFEQCSPHLCQPSCKESCGRTGQQRSWQRSLAPPGAAPVVGQMSPQAQARLSQPLYGALWPCQSFPGAGVSQDSIRSVPRSQLHV